MNTELKMHDILLAAITTTSGYEEWVYFLKNAQNIRWDGPTIMVGQLIGMYEKVPQGLKWHPEFELSKHVYLLSVSLHRQGRDDLLETAFLHDIGKVYCTNVGNDRIYSYGHAEVSAFYIDALQEFLKYYELTRSVTNRHMDYTDMGDPRIKNDLHMKEFVKADKKMSTVLFYEFFADEEEMNKKKQENVFREQRESKDIIYVTVGISGSGKSTYIRNNFYEDHIVSSDAIRKELTGDISNQKMNEEVWQHVRERLSHTLGIHGRAVLDATNVDKHRRIKLMSSFNGVRKVALVFPADVEECIARVRKDIADETDRSDVPENVIRRQEANFRKGLSSLVHEFNEIIVIPGSTKEGVVEEIKEALEQALTEDT